MAVLPTARPFDLKPPERVIANMSTALDKARSHDVDVVFVLHTGNESGALERRRTQPSAPAAAMRPSIGVDEQGKAVYQRYVIMLGSAGVGTCVALAAVSTAAWYLLTETAELAGGISLPMPARWAELPAWLLVWLSGTVYSALVLFRYLDPRGSRWRPVAACFAGALSYWIGVQYAAVLRPTENMLWDTAAAGVITAACIGWVMIRIGTLRFGPLRFAALCAAGGVGGAAIGWAVPQGYDPTFFAGHAAWQVLTCAALYCFPRSAVSSRGSSALG